MWHPRHYFDSQSSGWNSSLRPQSLGQENTFSSCMNPSTNMVFTNGTLAAHALSGVPHLQVKQASEPYAWFNFLPGYHKVPAPASNAIIREESPTHPYGNFGEAALPNSGPGCVQKRFLVFDQSQDHTTLIFSPGVTTPAGNRIICSPKPLRGCNINSEVHKTINHSNPPSPENLTSKFNEHFETGEQSEMHEDTEELNMLLYSDDESDHTEDDEVMSTGHSPDMVTAHDKMFEGNREEIAFSSGTAKKRKLFDEGCDDMPSLMDTASSVNLIRYFACEDNAESTCSNDRNKSSAEMDSISRNKRLRNERILDSVDILGSIVPDMKGKSAIVVLDEAIQYLKSLRLKAKDLGLGAL